MAGPSKQVASPDGRIVVGFMLRGGTPYYNVAIGGEQIVAPSLMGFTLADADLSRGLKLAGTTTSAKDTTWMQPWGEEDSVRCNYRELTVKLRKSDATRQRMDVQFRVFNDGVGFRYIVYGRDNKQAITVMEENTQFAFARDAKAWSIPTNNAEYYESIFTPSAISQKDTVCTPMTIEYGPGLYLAVHEAALTDYAKMNLTPTGGTLRAALSPWSDGTKVKATGKMTSPWRTVICGRTAGDLVTNRVMLNLNEPSKIENTSWIVPGKYLGIWWSIHKKKNTWEMGPHHGATTQELKRYIDFAARNGFSGVLSEGWNPGWGEGEKVTFLKTYPDFDIEEVTRYAQQRGVRWIAHTETWGNADLLESEMEQAFAWYASMGVRAVKTGYVGHLLNGKELPSSQYGIRHYRRVIECAARHQLMVDNHEPAMPTGLQRTWPNLMTQEGVRGQEYNAWDAAGGNPPAHTATLPFTRGLAGPMDFTPAIFDFSEIVPGTHPHSTIAKQLAEFVVLYSPLQMAADAIENYEYHPALSFISSCPTNWSRTIVANGEIGKYITTCRKERGGENWFVGSLTNEEARNLELPLSFLTPGKKYLATIYEDGQDADFERNPQAMGIRRIEVDSKSVLQLHLARSGGATIRLEAQ